MNADAQPAWPDALYDLPRRHNVTQFAYVPDAGHRVLIDNGHYGETGWQKSHTSLGVDRERIAVGSGIKMTRTISKDAELADGARLLRETNGTAFVLLRVKPTDPPAFKRKLDPAPCPTRL